MTAVTIGTAALAAVFLVTGIGRENYPPEGWREIVSPLTVGAAAAADMLGVVWAIRTVFTPDQLGLPDRATWKRRMAEGTFAWFGTTMSIRMSIVYLHVLHPTFQEIWDIGATNQKEEQGEMPAGTMEPGRPGD